MVEEAEILKNESNNWLLRIKCKHNKIITRNWDRLLYDCTRAGQSDHFDCVCDKEKLNIKREATCMKKYGVRNPTHHPAFSAKRRESAFKLKEFV